MAPKRRGPPTGDRRTPGIVSAGGFDIPRITQKTSRKQAFRRRLPGPGERAVARELARLDRHLQVLDGGRR